MSLELLKAYYNHFLQEAQQYREMWAKEVWLVERLLEHVPPEVALQVDMELQVNEMDPDFSFYDDVFDSGSDNVPRVA